MENLYELLEVSKNASDEVIQKAYKVLVKRYHPDVAYDKSTSEKMIKKINYAYSILSDKQKRHEYDMQCEQQTLKNAQVQYEHINYEVKKEEPYSEPTKVINIDNRLLILIIVVSIVLFIFSCISIYGAFDEMFNGKKVQYVDDDTSKYVLQSVAQSFVDFDIQNIQNQIINNNILNEDMYKSIIGNIDVYNKILPAISIDIIQVKATNENAEITARITRNDVETISMQYFLERSLNMDKINATKQKEILLKSINNYSNDKTVIDKFYAKKVDGQWKMSLTNSNIISLIGMSIPKYIDIFKAID